MKTKDKKLAEKIYNDRFTEEDTDNGVLIKPNYECTIQDELFEGMEQYHKDKLNEITDNDIMGWADKLRGNRWFGALIWRAGKRSKIL